MDRERWIGLSASVALHLAILLGSGAWIVKRAEYGMAPGRNSVAVDLVEGASEPEAAAQPLPQPEPDTRPQPGEMTEAVERTPPLRPEVSREAPKPSPKPHPVAIRGKGASGAGRDALTLRRASGTTSAQPDYLNNPPPPYPEECRCRGEQGTVVLKVLVSPRGTAQSVALIRSSGFGPLDRAALDAVRKWRFRPATVGGMPVESYVVVPIRFVLEG